MTRAELHYLKCVDPNCEKVYCVDKRFLESQIEANDVMELNVVKHHRDQLLEEVSQLKKLLQRY
jgi:hypothetical protein